MQRRLLRAARRPELRAQRVDLARTAPRAEREPDPPDVGVAGLRGRAHGPLAQRRRPARLDVRVTLEAAAPRRPGVGGAIPLAVDGGSGSGVVLPPGGEREFRAVWTPPARGLYVCRAALVSSDPWGWFAAARPAGEDERLWVYPSLYPLASPLPWPRHDSLDGSVRSAGLWEICHAAGHLAGCAPALYGAGARAARARVAAGRQARLPGGAAGVRAPPAAARAPTRPPAKRRASGAAARAFARRPG